MGAKSAPPRVVTGYTALQMLITNICEWIVNKARTDAGRGRRPVESPHLFRQRSRTGRSTLHLPVL